MLELLWLVPAIPFAGALVLAVLGARMSHRSVTMVGVGPSPHRPSFPSSSPPRS